MEELTARQVKQQLDSDTDIVLINTLGPDSFRAKRIPGSINIPTGQIQPRAKHVLPDKGQQIVVYCASPDCTASSKAAKKLTQLGYNNVYDFEGGLTGWLKEGFSLTKGNS
ncbi:rhodanese-like domain-containing protein [Aliifodinibius sp. S!AR15-10]|uniref:rhodanese-like domain-containing protein n=1 Tax=Aliifodinibius sp. S!AR15-10 TaxID=2950437 RepID=UPI00285A9AC2|nr:rhodanese-like domain-containing protein [Aliifodinibius sp. S!AR15-10]MDR8389834.1 rhodanese-like domain-containing protein [Aliifodinibius sp. S!AR15-10]